MGRPRKDRTEMVAWIEAMARHLVDELELSESQFFCRLGKKQTDTYNYPRFIIILLAKQYKPEVVWEDLAQALRRHPTAISSGYHNGKALLKTYPPFQVKYNKSKESVEQWLTAQSQ